MSAFEIEVKKEAHQFVSEVVRFAEGEVGGLAYVQLIEPGYFYIDEFVVLEQESSSASVDMESEAFVDEIMRAAENNRTNDLRCSWHSHKDMSVYYSSTDERAIADYKKLGIPWLVSLVYNKQGDIAPRLDIFDSEAMSHIKYENGDYSIMNDIPLEITTQAKDVVKRLVSKPKKAWEIKKDKDNKDKSKENGSKSLGEMTGWIDHEEDIEWGKDSSDIGEMIPYGLNSDDFEDKDFRDHMEDIYGEATVARWREEAKLYD